MRCSKSWWIVAVIVTVFVGRSEAARAQPLPCVLEFEAVSLPTPDGAYVTTGDLDDDGFTDIVLTAEGSYRRVFFGLGSETFQVVPGLLFALEPSVGDIDSDGIDDIVGRENGALVAQINSGFALFETIEIPFSSGFSSTVLIDLDNDSDLDVIALRRGDFSAAASFLNDGAGNFTFENLTGLPDEIGEFAIGDITGDGAVDLVIAHGSPGTGYSITRLTPEGTFLATQTISLPGITDVTIGEFDGVAPADLLLTRPGQPHLIRFGDGTEIAVSFGFGNLRRSVVADFDADGSLDFASMSGLLSGPVEVRLAAGPGDFFSPISASPFGAPRALALDMNGDGRADIVSTRNVQWNRSVPPDDCDGDGVVDPCGIDCNGNGIPDSCDIATGLETDLDGDGVPDSCQDFSRGDLDGDHDYDLIDAFLLLEVLFGRADLVCEDVADANDDGLIDLTDAVVFLSTLFVTGTPLPAPYPDCGVDLTPDAWECVTQPGCP